MGDMGLTWVNRWQDSPDTLARWHHLVLMTSSTCDCQVASYSDWEPGSPECEGNCPDTSKVGIHQSRMTVTTNHRSKHVCKFHFKTNWTISSKLWITWWWKELISNDQSITMINWQRKVFQLPLSPLSFWNWMGEKTSELIRETKNNYLSTKWNHLAKKITTEKLFNILGYSQWTHIRANKPWQG